MGDVDPVAIVQCTDCEWWWFFWDKRPTIPFICDHCKIGEPPWGDEIRKPTPSYGTPRARKQTIPFGIHEEVTRIVEPPPSTKKKPKRKR